MEKKLFNILLVILTIFSQAFANNSVKTSAVLTDSIIVTSPNGGEIWQAGTTQTITWTSDISDNVRIELFQGGTFHSVIVASTPNDSSYSWSIPPGTAITDRYKISIESTVDPSNFDLSDEDFTISSPDIMVTSPNGGEMWQAGEIHNITWTDNLVEPVKIELYKSGLLRTTIYTSTPSDEIQSWLIPFSFEGGSDYKIKISSTQFTTKFDYSDSNFTIIPNEITITSPTSSDDWHAGTTDTIKWNSNFSGNVSINLFKGGTFYKLISSTTANDGSFPYTIAFDEQSGSDYQIRVASLITSAVADTSEFFTITPNQINVTSPNGGEILYADSTHLITWTDNIFGNVKIELLENSDFSSLITASTPSNGAFNWNIPFSVQPGIDYRIKITALNSNNIFDISDTNFTIINLPTITSPNGGENWQLGSNHAITWIDNLSGNIEIDLWKGGVFYSVIDPSDPSDGVFNWSIPDSLEPDINYRIKITSRQDSNSFDFSDNDFTLSRGQIFVTRPNGGDYWLLGSNEDITWNDNIPGQVSIELLKSEAFYYQIDPATNSDGLRGWSIPDTLQPDTDYKIRITSIDDSTIFDISDSTFTLDFPQIQITEPNGGENWRIGTTYSITWTDFITENVKIELQKADTSYYEISSSTASDGLFNWKVPIEIPEGSDYKIMIRSINNSNIIDFSDNNFTILTVPANYELAQNFPNPFNLTTVIRYGVPEDGPVSLDVFDVTGQKILTLVNKQQARGFYEVHFYTGDLPSGIYLYRLVSGKFIELKKMILTK